jgi:hypothetical protein
MSLHWEATLILKPQTWHRPDPQLTTAVTWAAILLTATWLVFLIVTFGYDSSPPFMMATGTATALAWIWRMQLARTTAEQRADEDLIEAVRRQRPHDEARLREEEAFRQIAKHFEEGGDTCGLD